ncbi:MAG TPA: lasso peptide biosynthesis B2 protein [Pyrinomonadaceae bacterium]|nr:lasso peptide biosynthesis B2 protein [Pyrinomonadaceae bacterium]
MSGERAGFLTRGARAARFALREPSSALLVVRMAAWVMALTCLAHALPLPRVMRIMTPLTRRKPAADPLEVQQRLARLLDLLLATNTFVFTPTCWKRAPVLYRFLALNGIESRIVFGVRRDGERLFDGHAWLESGGEPLLEAHPPVYTVTFSFPS